jgi:hypothetical protein
VNSSWLTARGFGVIRLAVSGKVSLSGTLRPNRVPLAPIIGHDRSLKLPSEVRWAIASAGIAPFRLGCGGSSVS